MKTLVILFSAFAFAPLFAQEPFYLAPGTLAPFGLDSMEITALTTEPGNFQHSISDIPLFAGTRNGGVFAILPFSSKSKWQSIGFSGKTISCLNVRRFSAGPLTALTLQASVAFSSDSTREFVANGFFPQPPFPVDTSWGSADNDTAKQTLRAVYSMAGANENSPVVGPNKTAQWFGGGVIAGGNHGVMQLQLNSSESYPNVFLDSVVVNALVQDWNNSGVTLAGGSLNGIPVIYRSTDGGKMWTAASIPPSGSGQVNSLALVPSSKGDTVYAGTSLGLWRSTDDGRSWNGTRWNKSVEVVAVDQYHANAVAFYSNANPWESIDWSTDGGTHWKQIEFDRPMLATVTCMILIHPATTDSLPYVFLGTEGKGVWVYRPENVEKIYSKLVYFPLAKGNLWSYEFESGHYGQFDLTSDTLLSDGLEYAHIPWGLYEGIYLRQQGDSVLAHYVNTPGSYVRYDFTKEPGDTVTNGLWSIFIVQNQGERTIFGRHLRWWTFATQSHFDEGFSEEIVDSLGLVSYDQYNWSGSWHSWRLRGALIDGVQYGDITSIGNPALAEDRPYNFSLAQNYPNPFNPSTTIQYALPHRSHVTLTVFNTLGQQVAQLVTSDIDAGYHEIQFNATNLASGVYFYRLQAGSYVETKKLLLVR